MNGKLLIAALSLFLVASCDSRAADQTVGKVENPTGDVSISKWHDDQAGATCWVVTRRSNGGYGGVSCVADGFLRIPSTSPAPMDGGWPEVGDSRHVAGGPG